MKLKKLFFVIQNKLLRVTQLLSKIRICELDRLFDNMRAGAD